MTNTLDFMGIKGFNRLVPGIILILPVILMFLLIQTSAWAKIKPTPSLESSWFIDLNRYSRSAHGKLACNDCHDDIRKNGQVHPDPDQADFLIKDVKRTFDYKRCAKCHPVAYKRYLKGVHAQALQKQIEAAKKGLKPKETVNQAPTCGHCHQSHYDHSGMSRVAVGQRMVNVCGACHNLQAVSYLDNIHGRAGVYMENEGSAFCTDCHGAHTVATLYKPDRALAACVRCHPQVAKEFTDYIVHAVKSDTDAGAAAKQQSRVWMHRVRIIAAVVVIFALVFFFGHSMLQILRELHDKLRKH